MALTKRMTPNQFAELLLEFKHRDQEYDELDRQIEELWKLRDEKNKACSEIMERLAQGVCHA